MPETLAPVAMHQEWLDLTFLHWEVPVEVLRPFVPSQLSIDTFEGKAYIAVVPFTMRGIRLAAIPPVPGTHSFHETNVRTYVKYGDKPGVWFFSLEAANLLAVQTARAWFGLPYHFARMSMTQDKEAITYDSTRTSDGAVCHVRVEPLSEMTTAAPGSLEEFLFERYTLFALRRGRIAQGDVAHPPYTFCPAQIDSLRQTLTDAAGIELKRPPDLAHFSPGVKVVCGWPFNV